MYLRGFFIYVMKLNEIIQGLEQIKEFKQLSFCWGRINDVQKFIDTNVSYLKSNSGKLRFKPYYDRLLEFYLANK